jgi:tRNA dimethylallyltransferase
LKLVRAPAERQILHERIERRFRGMVDAGLVDEVAGLRARGDLTEICRPCGVSVIDRSCKYLAGEYSWDEMLHRGIVASRQLAKRQMTWLRAESYCHWLSGRSRSARDGRCVSSIRRGQGGCRCVGTDVKSMV